MPERVAALWFRPGRATPEPATVEMDGDALRVVGEGGEARVPVAALRLGATGFQSAGSLQVEWPDDGVHALVVTGDEIAGLTRILPPEFGAAARAVDARARGEEQRRQGLALGCLLAVIVSVLATYLLRDRILGAIVDLLPTSVDVKVGQLAAGHLADPAKVLPGGPAVDAVRAIGKRLLAAPPPQPYTFRFEVVRDDSVNAFALPGGVVVVHTGLIRKAGSPDELAGVLAHEVTHVLHRHAMRQAVFRIGLFGAASLLIGGDSAGAEAISGMVTGLGGLSFSRDQERDADTGGLDRLKAAHLPAAGLVTFFERLAADGGVVPPLLSTHPAPHDRAETLGRRLQAEGRWATEPIDVDWAAVQASLQ